MTNAKKHKTKIKSGACSNDLFCDDCHGHLANV